MAGGDLGDDRRGVVGETDAVIAPVAIEIEQRILRHEHDDRLPRARGEARQQAIEHGDPG